MGCGGERSAAALLLPKNNARGGRGIRSKVSFYQHLGHAARALVAIGQQTEDGGIARPQVVE
jgi:hypothetical protein